jgi:general secretion pathway protein A
MLAARFDLGPRARKSKAALLVELEAMLRRRHLAGDITVLVVDEAQSLPIDLLEEIRLLANIETNDDKLLPLILAGQPKLSAALEDPLFSQLKQRVALWCELRPLTLEETVGYMLGRIRSAGGIATDVFTADAVTLIHTAAKGVPRTINVLADNALLTGLAAETRPVTSQIVQDVCRDFRISQPHRSAPAAEATPAHTANTVFPAERRSVAGEKAPGDAPVARAQPERPMFSSVSRRYFS